MFICINDIALMKDCKDSYQKILSYIKPDIMVMFTVHRQAAPFYIGQTKKQLP